MAKPGYLGDQPALVGVAPPPPMVGEAEPQDMDWVRGVLATFGRNAKYAKPQANYQTALPPDEEAAFRSWVVKNKVPFDPAETLQDYDMRGYWQSLQKDGPAGTAVNPRDGKLHFPDTFKTPYHESFSSQSQYAAPGAPVWTADETRLVDPATYQVLFDERAKAKRK